MVFISGLPPFDPQTGEIKRVPMARQAELVLEQMKDVSRPRARRCRASSSATSTARRTPRISPRSTRSTIVISRRTAPAVIFLHVPSWPGPFDVEIDCVAGLSTKRAVEAARMFAHGIETATPGLIALLAVSLVIAGLVKGLIGVGMPIVAFPMLSMLVDVQTAVMLLSVPLVLSNIPQALEGGFIGKTLWSLGPGLAGMIPGIWIGVAVLLTVDLAAAKIVAGLSVILVAALTLLAPKLKSSSD